MANSLNIIARMRLVLLRVLKACRARASAASKVIYEPVNCSALQYYPGYEPSDYQLVAKYATQKAEINADHYIDGFGVKTNFSCVAFASAVELKREKLQFPLPDDGLHAEGVEYAAILDAFCTRPLAHRFVAAEIGSGWGPWIGLAGVLSKREDLEDVTLIGAEASPERFRQMTGHLHGNGLLSSRNFKLRCIEKAVWVHDGEINFPVSPVEDMGAAATENIEECDYRGNATTFRQIQCAQISSICHGVGLIDFMHIDVQGAELRVISNEITWLTKNVRSLLVATHSRVIEGGLIEVFAEAGWILKREKPCRFHVGEFAGAYEGKTYADGSQHWISPSI